MPRRGDPDRIYQAQRAGIFTRLRDTERVNELYAEHWIARWAREAEASRWARDSQGYWDAGWPMDRGEPPEALSAKGRHRPFLQWTSPCR
jgi:hypothetical protein